MPYFDEPDKLFIIQLLIFVLSLSVPFPIRRKKESGWRSESRAADLLNRFFYYIKVYTATRWSIRNGLMLLWFIDLMSVTEEVTIHRPNVSTLPVSTQECRSVGSMNCNFFGYIH